MGGAQPLAVTLNGGAFLGVDIDPSRIQKRVETRYLDKMTHDYNEAVKWVMDAKNSGQPLSVGLVGNIVDVLQRLLKDKIIPDLATDQTSAHDPLNGYIPVGLSLADAAQLRRTSPQSIRAGLLLQWLCM